MSAIITTSGRQFILNQVFCSGTKPVYKLRLFTNDKTPSASDILSNLTEMSANGYSPITLQDSDFTVSQVNGIDCITISEKGFTFVGGIPANIYGYYLSVTVGTTDTLVFAERFVQPKAIQFSTDKIEVSPTINLTQTQG